MFLIESGLSLIHILFEGHQAGNLNPASILNHFINDEDTYRQVAALFNANLKESLNNEEQKKAFSETIKKIKMCIRDSCPLCTF